MVSKAKPAFAELIVERECAHRRSPKMLIRRREVWVLKFALVVLCFLFDLLKIFGLRCECSGDRDLKTRRKEVVATAKPIIISKII